VRVDDSSSESLAAGSESIRTLQTQTLEVDYSNLSVYFSAGWFYWNSSHSECEIDSPYFVLRFSDTEYHMEQP